MLITGFQANVVNIIIDCDDLTVLKCALMSTDLDRFDETVGKLQERSILSSELDYAAVVGQAVITISHFENNLLKFKDGEQMKKVLQEAVVTTPVN